MFGSTYISEKKLKFVKPIIPDIVYAPYIPIQDVPTILSDDSFTPTKLLSSKYAVKKINSDFYGKIEVTS